MERVLLLFLSLCALSWAQSGSGSGNGTVNGTGSGNGEIRNCSDLQCSHGCNETEVGPMCYCPSGYSLSEPDMMTCQPCPGGLFGVNCANSCNCSNTGHTCNRNSGICECNSCYNGTRCEQVTGSFDCFVQFLEIADKNFNNLRNMYGGVGYPTPPESVLQLLAADIMDAPPSLISDVDFTPVDRTDVNQGDLVKLSWQVDRSLDLTGAQEALLNLSNKVKLGIIRATYITQDSADNIRARVTLNSGVKED